MQKLLEILALMMLAEMTHVLAAQEKNIRGAMENKIYEFKKKGNLAVEIPLYKAAHVVWPLASGSPASSPQSVEPGINCRITQT